MFDSWMIRRITKYTDSTGIPCYKVDLRDVNPEIFLHIYDDDKKNLYLLIKE